MLSSLWVTKFKKEEKKLVTFLYWKWLERSHVLYYIPCTSPRYKEVKQIWDRAPSKHRRRVPRFGPCAMKAGRNIGRDHGSYIGLWPRIRFVWFVCHKIQRRKDQGRSLIQRSKYIVVRISSITLTMQKSHILEINKRGSPCN